MSAAAENPYSASRINKGLKHFLLGKGLTSAAGICTLLLVVRGLDIAEFAAYSVLLGLVELLLSITNVGTGQIFTRYVPEAYTLGYRHALRRMVVTLLALRYVVLLFAVLLLFVFAEAISGWIGLERWLPAFRLYLLVVLFRTVTSTIFQVLEAMLHQGSSQAVLATVTVSRFLLVATAYGSGHLDLMTLIWIEVATDVTGACLMLWTLNQASLPPSVTSAQDEWGWLRNNRRRMISFGAKGYLQHLIIMPFSGVVNRLVVGGSLPGAQVALFGFAQSIYDLMQRFLPAQLFVGLVRPVMAARYSKAEDFREVQVVTNVVLKVNLVLIGLVATVFVAGGSDMLLFVTAGKYGEPAVNLLLLMSLLIALESWRHVLDLLSHTVERYGILIFTNAILGSSLLAGILLLPSFGVFALPAANCVGLIVSNLIVVRWLAATGFPFHHDLRMILGSAFSVACTVSVTLLARPYLGHWAAEVSLALLVYAAISLATLKPRSVERELWSKLVLSSRSRA
jgi:O-antigen/teichoic acid export membrane protein